VVGQVNILSAYLHGEPGRLPVPTTIKYRLAHNVCLRRKCQDTGQSHDCSLEKDHVW
jgi:hypothetical protein